MSWDHDELFHAWWVDDGRILAGEYPGAPSGGEKKAAAKANLLLDAGVRTVIDLTEPDELDPYEETLLDEAARRGIEVVRISHPIPDNHVIDRDGYDDILASIDAGLERGAVFVHCWGGMGRTSTVIGRHLRRNGLTYDETIAEIARLRSGTRKAGQVCPQSQSQHEMLWMD